MRPPRPAFLAVLLVLGGMSFIVLAGGITLAVISPDFVAATWEGLTGRGNRSGILLFTVQLIALGLVVAGLLYWSWRHR